MKGVALALLATLGTVIPSEHGEYTVIPSERIESRDLYSPALLRAQRVSRGGAERTSEAPRPATATTKNELGSWMERNGARALRGSSERSLPAPLFPLGASAWNHVARGARSADPSTALEMAAQITLDVDATDVERGIFRVSETIRVARAGRLTLLFPKWVPGNHAP